ncbi:MAG: hypothetical protein IT352_15565 [Gemmatimonadales bacterium]|nr:hypothetical protein [Gemmatimonadales bacterium]
MRTGFRNLVSGLLLVGLPAAGASQGRRTVVQYDVEFSVAGSQLDRNCAASGNDILTGTLVGLEPPDPDEPNEYVGTLMRSTRITTCGSRTSAAGHDVVCSINIAGGGFPKVVLTVDAGRGEGYFQYATDSAHWAPPVVVPPPQGQAYSQVTGTCDPAELAQLEAEYDGGQTAGSPSGQPIEMTALHQARIPVTFPANPPRTLWTLRILARRP